MPRKLIKITQKHINKGKRRDFNFCPVAIALVDSGFGFAFVVSGGITVMGHKGISAPRSVNSFLYKFDSKGKKAVKPFNFYLKLED
jgi:hypothetical protein